MEELYIKDSEIIEVGDSFIYETFVYLRTKRRYMVVNSARYESFKPINNIVKNFRKTSNITITTELLYAPKNWLIEEGYVRYYKPEKMKRVKKLKEKKDG